MFRKSQNLFPTLVIITIFAAVLGSVVFGLFLLTREEFSSRPTQSSSSQTTSPQVYAYSIEVPARYNEILTISAFGDSFSIKPLSAKAAERKEENPETVKYIDAYQNTDVVQTRQTSKVKEDIILKQSDHPEKFEYQIDITKYDYEKNKEGDFVFYEDGRLGQNAFKKFTIPAPFMIDAKGRKSATGSVKTSLSETGILTLEPDQKWLVDAVYPVVLDPTIEISILNVHSSPQLGEEWVVEFTTLGKADLKIIPNDQATIDDDEFSGLWCGAEKKQPQILKGDIIYFPGWECNETGKVVHKTIKAGKHVLKFDFGGEIAFAYNDSDQFTSSGTWYAPTGVTSVQVECWGGGGGGDGEYSDVGGGGGGGAYSKKNTVSVTPGSGYSVTVGAGGNGSEGSPGQNGGDSYFIDTSTVLAKGGRGSSSETGGSGGQASSGVGDVKYSGGNGANGSGGTPGGGGGGAGTTGPGGNASGGTGGTGTANWGGNGGNSQSNAEGVPNSPLVFGGGGGGGYYGDTPGDGKGGQCIITYTVDVDTVIIKASDGDSIFKNNVIFK